MHDREKSDSAIVAVKPSNKARTPAAEAVEPRAGTKGNADQQSTHRTQSRARVTQALDRVRQAPERRLAVTPRGRSRMLESGSSGSVRGASSNGRPYREPRSTTVTDGADRWLMDILARRGVAFKVLRDALTPLRATRRANAAGVRGPGWRRGAGGRRPRAYPVPGERGIQWPSRARRNRQNEGVGSS